MIFCFKQKTAYEMRISDWSSDVCSSDLSDFQDTVRQLPLLADVPVLGALLRSSEYQNQQTELVIIVTPHLVQPAPAGSLATPAHNYIGRPSCRERVFQYLSISVVVVSLTKHFLFTFSFFFFSFFFFFFFSFF